MDRAKLHTLSARFTEGPSFPASLLSGPSAFPRLRLEYQAAATLQQSTFSTSFNSKVHLFRYQLIQLIKQAASLQAKFVIAVGASDKCDELKTLATGLSQIRELICNIVEQLAEEKEAVARLKAQERKVLQKGRRLATQCFVEHSRALRELELFNLMRMTNEFGLQLFLQPAREPFPTTGTPTGGGHQPEPCQLPSAIQGLLQDMKSHKLKMQRHAGQMFLDGESFKNKRLNCSLKSLKLPPSVNGRFSLTEFCQLANILLPSSGYPLDASNSEDAAEFQSQVSKQSQCAWSTYHTALKRFRRFADEQASPYRFFPVLRQDQQIRLLNLLGKGGFAEVWEGLYMDTLEIRAVKVTEFRETASLEERELILTSTCREVSLQRTLKHPHVVEMQHCFEITPFIFVAVLELCDGGSLDAVIQNYGPIPERLAKLWIFQLLKALEYLHVKGKVVHFDLKPLNILLHNSSVKIADFGLHQSVSIQEGKVTLDMRHQSNQVGTVWYMPPEHLRAVLLHEKSEFDGRFDIWSIGIVFYEMLFQRRPFGQFSSSLHGLTPDHVAALIYKDVALNRLRFPEQLNPVSDQCKKFIRRLLQSVDRRPTATEALKDELFTNVE